MTDPDPVPNILTAEEAAAALRCEETDPAMLGLLPMVDAYVAMATGRDWAADEPIYAEAKSAARMLLVQWFENPAMQAGYTNVTPLNHGLAAALSQLEAKALELEEDEEEDSS